MKKTILPLLFLLSCGCAPLLPAVETVSTILSLGNIGQTIITMTQAGPAKFPVGQTPPHYHNNRERMIREAWEQNYQLAGTLSWEAEDESWKEIAATTARKVGKNGNAFALVARSPQRTDTRREEITVYHTISGRVVTDPRLALGEHFYPQTHTRAVTVPIYTYTACFFTKSRQPTGILATDAPPSPGAPYGKNASLIQAVGKKTPAHKTQLQAGDIITSVNGRDAPYHSLFSLFKPGENTLTICRNGRFHTAQLSLPIPGRSP